MTETLDQLLLPHLWSVWLDYRLPHYDVMEHRAAETLTGSKAVSVRSDFNGGTGMSEAGHVTLFTLASETPDPAAALAAAKDFCPVWDVTHHEVVSGVVLPVESAEPKDPRAKRLATALRDLLLQSAKASVAGNDPRTPEDGKIRLDSQVAARAAALATEIEQVLTEGLHSRHLTFIKPVAIIQGSMLDDWHAYRFLCAIRKVLRSFSEPEIDVWRPEGIAVCQACTAVFAPMRRTADYCGLCRKRQSRHDVIGAAPFDSSAPQTVRIPKRRGNVVVGWGTKTLQGCPRCGAAFAGRRDAKACMSCSAAARQQRRRDRRADHDDTTVDDGSQTDGN